MNNQPAAVEKMNNYMNERLCKVSAIKFTWIAEPQPTLWNNE